MMRERSLFVGLVAFVAGLALPVAVWAVTVVNGPDCPTTGHGTTAAASQCDEPASFAEAVRAALGLRGQDSLAAADSAVPGYARADAASVSESARTRIGAQPIEPVSMGDNAATGQRASGNDTFGAGERASFGIGGGETLALGSTIGQRHGANKPEPITLSDVPLRRAGKAWTDIGAAEDSGILFSVARPLAAGWSLISIPVAAQNNKVLATAGTVGTPNQDGLLNPGHVAIAYKFDGVSQGWVQVTSGTTIAPLEAVMVNTNQTTTLTLIYSRAVTALPSRTLSQGWNLVGLAVPPETSSMPANQALASAYQLGNGDTGYTLVVSPPHNQPAFTWGRDLGAPNLLRWRGYWVYMQNADILDGFSTTPLP